MGRDPMVKRVHENRKRNSRSLRFAPPDFLWNMVALTNFMRLSLRKAAYVALASARGRKSGHAPVGGCDFFNFNCGLWPESSEEHLPTSIAGVLRLRAINPPLCDRSARRFAQDDAFLQGTKQHLVGCKKQEKIEKVTGSPTARRGRRDDNYVDLLRSIPLAVLWPVSWRNASSRPKHSVVEGPAVSVSVLTRSLQSVHTGNKTMGPSDRIEARRADRQTSAQPGRAGSSSDLIRSAVGAALRDRRPLNPASDEGDRGTWQHR